MYHMYETRISGKGLHCIAFDIQEHGTHIGVLNVYYEPENPMVYFGYTFNGKPVMSSFSDQKITELQEQLHQLGWSPPGKI